MRLAMCATVGRELRAASCEQAFSRFEAEVWRFDVPSQATRNADTSALRSTTKDSQPGDSRPAIHNRRLLNGGTKSGLAIEANFRVGGNRGTGYDQYDDEDSEFHTALPWLAN